MFQILRIQKNFHFLAEKGNSEQFKCECLFLVSFCMYYYVFISQLSYKVQMRKLAFSIKKSNSIEQMKSFLFTKIKNKLAALSALQWSNHLIIPNNKLLNVTMYYLNMLDLE